MKYIPYRIMNIIDIDSLKIDTKDCETKTSFNIKCCCGGVEFDILKRIKPHSEKLKIEDRNKKLSAMLGLKHPGLGVVLNISTDKDGNDFYYYKPFLKRKRIVRVSDLPLLISREQVVLECAICKSKYILYDGGVDGLLAHVKGNDVKFIKEGDRFSKLNDKPTNVCVDCYYAPADKLQRIKEKHCLEENALEDCYDMIKIKYIEDKKKKELKFLIC